MKPLEQEVRAEVATAVKEYMAKFSYDEDTAYCLAFNNFHLKLPFSGRREILDRGGTLDDPILDDGTKTSRQLYKDMDEVVSVAGLDMEKIRQLQQEAKRDIHKRRELIELAFPVYVMMRERGYTRSELNT